MRNTRFDPDDTRDAVPMAVRFWDHLFPKPESGLGLSRARTCLLSQIAPLSLAGPPCRTVSEQSPPTTKESRSIVEWASALRNKEGSTKSILSIMHNHSSTKTFPLFEPRRELGRTGFKATMLGIGDLADRNIPFETCIATVRRAIDAGLNLIDTAPNYENGYSEQIVGEAVKGARDHLFIIDKIDELEMPIEAQIDASLQRLNLDHTEAVVFHNLSSMETFQRLIAPGGGFDQLAGCIKAGKTRFRGISSHHPDVLNAAITAGLCDIVMFPVGPFVDARYVTEILPLARSHGIGTVGFKTFGAGKLLGDTTGYNQPLQLRPRGKLSSGGSDATAAVLPRLSVRECLHYTLTIDPDVALLGLSFPNEQDAAFAAAVDFQRLTPEQMEGVRLRALEARKNKGPCWWNPDPNI